MKNVKLISFALSMFISFVSIAQEKITAKDTLLSTLTNEMVICAPPKLATKEPLYILDGIIIDSKHFSKVNPNDIENISILKGIDATSLYGNQAINGVIILTTKEKD